MNHCLLVLAICLLLSSPEAIADEVKSTPKLEWESLPDAISYDVEFSTDKEFLNIIMTKTTKNNVTNWNQNKPGTFYWRVRGIDKDGNAGEFSEVASFEAVQSPPSQEEVIQTSIEPPRPKSLILPQAHTKSFSTPPQVSPPQPSPVVAEQKPVLKPWEPQGPWALELRGLGTLGQMSDSAGYFPSRSMLTETAAFALGYRLRNFIPSLYGEYFISGQLAQPSSVQNQNANGTGYLVGAELKWKKNKFSIAGSYLFLGQYQLSQQTAASQTSVYSNPAGFYLNFGYALSPRLSFLVLGKYVSYRNWNLLGNPSGDSTSQVSYGLGLSYELF